MWDFFTHQKATFAGLLGRAKCKESLYQPGVRSDDWRKIKRLGWRAGRESTN